MKSFIFALCLFGVSLAQAEQIEMPQAQISSETLGGAILLLQMKHTLVIDGAQNSEVKNELGDETKKEFFKSMVQGQTPQNLKEIYSRSDRPATHAVILRYESLISPQKVTLQ